MSVRKGCYLQLVGPAKVFQQPPGSIRGGKRGQVANFHKRLLISLIFQTIFRARVLGSAAEKVEGWSMGPQGGQAEFMIYYPP